MTGMPTLSARGQVTIPKVIRNLTGLKGSDRVVFWRYTEVVAPEPGRNRHRISCCEERNRGIAKRGYW